MQILTKQISELKPYEKNPRKNNEAVPYVMESIKQFGFKVPIVIDKDNVIICGHTRYKAAKKLKMTEVPCIMADDLTDEQVKAYRLADNKVAEKAEWDFELLADELNDILDFDMGDFGFEDILEEMEEPEAEEDYYDEPLPEEPKSQQGQIYQLGRHRLMVGDSTNTNDVSKLMIGKMADLVVTDPPYNVAISNVAGMTIKNDDMGETEFIEFLTLAFTNLKEFLKAGGVFYIWYASLGSYSFYSAVRDVGLQVREQLIWNKNIHTIGRNDYHWKHEPCLYGWKDGAAHYYIDDRTQTTVMEDKPINPRKLKKEELIKLVEDAYAEKVSTTVLNEDKPLVSDLHPTMKPIKLMGRLIKNSSKPDEIVLDLFGGSGSTLMACEQLNRTCYMMEFDPKYADTIIDRWETYTGQKAVLIEN